MAKKKKDTYKNDAEFEAAADYLVTLMLQLNGLKAQSELEVNGVLAKYGAQMETLAADIKGLHAKVKAYAEKHAARLLPDDKKSAETGHAEWGIRKTPDALKTLPGWTWDRVISALIADDRGDLLNVVTSVNKSVTQSSLSVEELANYGMCVTSKEEFFINPLASK